MDFVSISAFNYIAPSEVAAVLDMDSIASKSYIQKIKEEGLFIDLTKKTTRGTPCKTRTMIILKTGWVIFTDLRSDTVKERILHVNQSSGDANA